MCAVSDEPAVIQHAVRRSKWLRDQSSPLCPSPPLGGRHLALNKWAQHVSLRALFGGLIDCDLFIRMMSEYLF